MATIAFRDRERAGCRRPITSAEVPYLDALGGRVRAVREQTGRSRTEVARCAGIAASTLRRIEWGTRRTRLSTLHRIVLALAPESEAPAVLADLRRRAGPALALESAFRNRVERRRGRRLRRQRQRLRAGQLAAIRTQLERAREARDDSAAFLDACRVISRLPIDALTDRQRRWVGEQLAHYGPVTRASGPRRLGVLMRAFAAS